MKKLFLALFAIVFSVTAHPQGDAGEAKRCYKFCMGERGDAEFCRKVCYEKIDPREPVKAAVKAKAEPASAPQSPVNH